MIDRPAPSSPGWQRWLPGLQALRGYRAEWLRDDLAAGLVLATMLVPVGIAYAVASGVPGILRASRLQGAPRPGRYESVRLVDARHG